MATNTTRATMALLAMKTAPPMAVAANEQPATIASSAPAAASAASAAPPNKKRPAESPAAPSMTKAAAAKALSSINAPKHKSKSQYVRFKSFLLMDAKQRGDTETSDNITKIAKDAWSTVKNIDPPPPVDPATNTNDASATSNLSEDTQRYLLLKGRAIKAEQEDNEKFNTEVKVFCTDFLSAATSHLQWHTIDATEDNFAPLEDAVELVTNKYGSTYWSSAVNKSPLLKSLKEAKTQLAHFRELKSEQALVAKLRNATDDELLQHVKEHRRLLVQVADLNIIKRQKQAQQERQREAEERELSRADSIQYDITKALCKQMKYTDSSLKYRSVNISYTRGGVSQKVFAKAFKVAVGTKKATIAGREVGTKSLRYGADLACSDVNVKLVGEELVAQTSYYMRRM